MIQHVIGAGVGRTDSLKLEVNRLGLGPCHHMEEVLLDHPRQVPLWDAALRGDPAWHAIFDGYRSTVDWPTAGFVRELHAAFPAAKFVLTVRPRADRGDPPPSATTARSTCARRACYTASAEMPARSRRTASFVPHSPLLTRFGPRP